MVIQCWIQRLELGDTVLDTQVVTRRYSAGYTGWNTVIQCWIHKVDHGDTVLDTQVRTRDKVLDTQLGTR